MSISTLARKVNEEKVSFLWTSNEFLNFENLAFDRGNFERFSHNELGKTWFCWKSNLPE
jgi:hypothetical protein